MSFSQGHSSRDGSRAVAMKWVPHLSWFLRKVGTTVVCTSDLETETAHFSQKAREMGHPLFGSVGEVGHPPRWVSTGSFDSVSCFAERSSYSAQDDRVGWSCGYNPGTEKQEGLQ